MVGGQDAGIGGMVSYSRVPKTPSGTQVRTVWTLPTSHPVGKTDTDAGDDDSAAMTEKQGAGEHGSEFAPSLPGLGNLPKRVTKKVHLSCILKSV